MRLSVVIPVYNEAAVLDELTRRARAAALACGVNAEVLVVDDASTDGTEALAARLADDVVRFVRLAENRGQTGATLAGVARARGRVVVVLDGDLQDPPEVIPALYAALRDHPVAAVAYAVKRERREGASARAAFALYHGLQRAFGAHDLPPGAGSFCAFRARALPALLDGPPSRANLATLLARQGAASVSVPYTKERRAAGDSRVGAWGLCREALDSLAATGALANGARAAALGWTAASSLLAPHAWLGPSVLASSLCGVATVALASAYERRVTPERAAGAQRAR